MADQYRKTERINCSPLVTHNDINRYIDYCKERCDTDRLLMQEARQLATKTWQSWREDCEIFCYGDHLSLSFWSGNATNTFVVEVLDKNITISEDRESWKKWGVSCLSYVWNAGKTFVCWIVHKSIDLLKAVGSIIGVGSIFQYIGSLFKLAVPQD